MERMKVLPFVGILLIGANAAFGCANINHTDFKGGSTDAAHGSLRQLKTAIKTDTSIKALRMEMALRGASGATNRSDYAVALMFLGRSKEAIEILSDLEKQTPGLYFVAANLGTALELSGNNRDALVWIREGIRRNPQSHDETEWLHVKILEANIRQETQRDYFEKHSVLDLDPNRIVAGTAKLPNEMTPTLLKKAISHQLGERLQFVKAPNIPVAGLLVDLGAIETATGTLETAKEILGLALQFGAPNAQVQPLIEQFERTIWWHHARTNAMIGAGVVAFLVLLWFLYKRGIFVLSAKDLKP